MANDEHGQVLGKRTQNGANAEGGTTQNHDQFPATNARHRSGEETEEGPCSKSLVVFSRCDCHSMQNTESMVLSQPCLHGFVVMDSTMSHCLG